MTAVQTICNNKQYKCSFLIDYRTKVVLESSFDHSKFIRVIDGLTGNRHFDEDSGTTIEDSSGKHNDGTLENDLLGMMGKFNKKR